MYSSKKSQFFVLSSMFLFLLLFFIYSLETENTYIIKSGKFIILSNMIHETCQVGYLSNGSQIDARYSNFSVEVDSYCSGYDYVCNLSIVNNTQIPPSGNWSLLNYTHYNYSIYYSYEGFNYSGNFTC